MKEKLILRNFGPIKNVELEFGRFNVLIGEQATGKSTIAKVLAVCRYFSYIINGYKLDDPFLNGLLYYKLTNAIQPDTYISYECDDYHFYVERTGPDFPSFSSTLIAKSNKFKHLISELESIDAKPIRAEGENFSVEGWRIPSSFFQNDVSRVMDNPFYLPTERGLQSIFSLGKNPDLSDSLFNQLSEIKRITDNTWFNNDIEIEPLDIIYRNENGIGKVKKNRETDFFLLNNAASGYQSAIPIVLLMKYYTEIRKKKKTFIVEEPEQNLFPTAQDKLVKFFADKAKSHNAILLTTHSPYILTSLNNLIYAYQVGQIYKKEVGKVIEEKYWVNPEQVSAYLLEYDEEQKGVVQESILDKEGLVKVKKIDGISSVLNNEFNKLMNIELNIADETIS